MMKFRGMSCLAAVSNDFLSCRPDDIVKKDLIGERVESGWHSFCLENIFFIIIIAMSFPSGVSTIWNN